MPLLQAVWRRTWDVIWEVQKHQISYFAGALAYFSFFSLFPMLLLAAAILGHSPDWMKESFQYLYNQIPYASSFVRDNLHAIRQARGSLGFIAVVALIWSASGILQALETGFNHAWGVKEGRAWYFNIAIAFGILGLLLVVVAMYTATTAGFLLMGTRFATKYSWLQIWVFEYTYTATATSLAFNWLIFIILFKLIPNRPIALKDVWGGALLTAVLLELVKAVFTWYSLNYARFELIYGSIGIVMALLMWIYIVAQIIFVGLAYAVVAERDHAERARQRLAEEFLDLPHPGEEGTHLDTGRL